MNTAEKIGQGFSKIKQGVLGRSLEGTLDSVDPAFDLADICPWQLSGHHGVSDLSTWRVSIPKLSTGQDSNGKACFVFVIEVQRIDLTAQKANSEELQWCVERRYSEFYALESKLTEFHGEFEDAKLPAKAKLFSGKGLDVMQSKKEPFEDYLRCLLQKPALKGSDILFTFLTSSEEFTVAASNLGIGKMIKNVPIKLIKERGQSLQPFIASFISSTQPGPPKPRYDYVISTEEHEFCSERPVLPHGLFRDNLGAPQGVKLGHCNKYFLSMKERQEKGVFDTLAYLAVKIFEVSRMKSQLIMGFRTLFRHSFDALVEYAIASKLVQVLSIGRVAHLCRLLEEAIFDSDSNRPRTDEEKEERKKKALYNFQSFLCPIVQRFVGQDMFEKKTEMVFNSLQNPIINKQLALVLLDTALAELFPELLE